MAAAVVLPWLPRPPQCSDLDLPSRPWTYGFPSHMAGVVGSNHSLKQPSAEKAHLSPTSSFQVFVILWEKVTLLNIFVKTFVNGLTPQVMVPISLSLVLDDGMIPFPHVRNTMRPS